MFYQLMSYLLLVAYKPKQELKLFIMTFKQHSPYEIQTNEFELFKCFLYEQAGILLAEHKKHLVANRLARRLRHFHFSDYKEYYELVQSNPNEHRIAIDLLTTNETYFFREPKHFDFLKNQILNQWPNNKKLRCWSAAASTGEESYSLAMLLDSVLGIKPWDIFASDINHSVLKKAKAAHYLMDRIDGIPQEFLKKYCLKGTGEYQGSLLISPKIRNKVTFSPVNLTQPFPQNGKFDIIFLRNVMIYFDNKTKEKIIAKMTSQLSEGGYLFIGHTESLKAIKHNLVEVTSTIFRKNE